MKRGFLLVTGLAALAMLAATGQSGLKITGAWVRATPPGAPTTAVYALIENVTGQPDRLVGVETDAAEAAEVHTMSMENGMMVMKPVEGGLAVPAHGTLHLKPGGYHIMLIHPKQTIAEGQQVQVTLVFEQAGRVTLPIVAKQAGAMGAQGMGGGHGMGPAGGQGQPVGQGHPMGAGGPAMGHGSSK